MGHGGSHNPWIWLTWERDEVQVWGPSASGEPADPSSDPPAFRVTGEPEEIIAGLSERMAGLCDERRWWGRPAAILLDQQRAATLLRPIGQLGGGQQTRSARYEVAQQLRVDASEVITAVAPVAVDGPLCVLTGAHRPLLQSLCLPLTHAGVEVKVVASFEARMAEHWQEAGRPDGYDRIVHLDVRPHHTTIGWLVDGRLAALRDVPIGTEELALAYTRPILRADEPIHLDPDQAREILHDVGIPPLPTEECIHGDLTARELRSLVEPVIQRLAKELKHLHKQIEEDSTGEARTGLMITGHGRQVPGLGAILTRVVHGEPVSSEDAERHHRSLDGLRPETLSLVPWLVRHVQGAKTVARGLTVAAVVFLGLIVAHGPILSQRLAKAQAAQRQMVAGLERAGRPMADLWQSNAGAIRDVKHALTARECRRRQACWPELLREAARTKPPGVELVAIESTWTEAGYRVLLCGTISADRQAEVVANDWFGKLRQCGRFSDVRFGRLQRTDASDRNGPIAVHIACMMKRETDEALVAQD